MKAWVLSVCLAFAGGGDAERGLQLYAEGRFAEAVAAFEAAIADGGDSAELQYNLALAAWRARDFAKAEVAVEKYAALSKDARADLHAGLLGALRYDEAKGLQGKAADLLAGAGAAPQTAAPSGEKPEDPLPVLEQALEKATQSRSYSVKAAQHRVSPELVRNMERATRLADELEKQIEELKKQREQQKKDGEKKPDDEKKNEDEKKDEQQKKDDESKQEQKPEEQQPGEQKPEPSGENTDDKKKGQEQKPETGESAEQPQEPKPSSGDQKQQPPPGGTGEEKPEAAEKPEEKAADDKKPGDGKAAPRSDAPGEQAEGKELTPEQFQRLLEELKKLDAKRHELRLRAKSSRPPVERDW